MTPEERQVITAIFERLRTAENHPRDPEAERLISELIARQPYAPYAMAQSIYVGEQALARLNSRVCDLEARLEEARSKPQSSGFLSGLFGGDRPEPRPASPGSSPQYPQGQPAPGASAYPAAPQAGPWGGQPQPGPWSAPAQGGGFLQNALTTAAGVAGGMVVANALSSAFSGHGWGASGLGALGGGFGSSANDVVDQAFAAGERTGRDETLAQQDQRDDQIADASDASFDDDNSSDGSDYSTDV